MIYHAFPAGDKMPASWWAVHAETLTPIRINGDEFPLFALEIIKPPENETQAFSSHPGITFDPKTIAGEVIQSIRRHLHPQANIKTTRLIARAKAKVPEYLIIFDGAGENPAIFRSAEPHLIIPTTPQDDSVLGTPSHWLTATDLSAEGWAYWWEDCQRALEELAPALIAG